MQAKEICVTFSDPQILKVKATTGVKAAFMFVTSRVSSRVNRIGPICVSVCACVPLSALSRLNHLTYGQEILHVGQPGPYLGHV